MKFSVAATAVALVVSAGLTPSSALAQSGETITVYNAQHAELTQAWADAFTKETGIKVTLRQGSDTELGNQIVQEGASSPADVFITENSPAMALVDKAGLFASLAPATLALVPEQYRPTDGKWTGVAARTTVFAYNKTKLAAGQAAEVDARPRQSPSGRAAGAHRRPAPTSRPSSARSCSSRARPRRCKWLMAEKTNSVAYRGNTAVMRAVNAGEIEGGIIYHYYYFGDQAKTGENSNNVALHYFRNGDPGAFVSISGAGVLASSKHKEAAEAFVKWIAGKGGQTILRDGTSFEYAIGVGAEANPKLEPLANLGAPRVEPATLDSKRVTELMNAAEPPLRCRRCRHRSDPHPAPREGRFAGGFAVRTPARRHPAPAGDGPGDRRRAGRAAAARFRHHRHHHGRLGDRCGDGLPAAGGRAPGQHRAARGAHPAVRDRLGDRARLAHRADRPAGRAGVGVAGGGAAGGAGVRAKLRLDGRRARDQRPVPGRAHLGAGVLSRSSTCRLPRSSAASIRRSRTRRVRSAYAPAAVFVQALLPQLRVAIAAGALLVGLHLLSEYGLYGMIRFDTFTTAIIDQFQSSYAGPAANMLAVVLVACCFVLLAGEGWARGGARYARVGSGAPRPPRRRALGAWRWPALILPVVMTVLALGVPLMTLARWLMFGGAAAWSSPAIVGALGQTLVLAIGAAIVTVLAAMPMAWLATRSRSALTRLLEAGHYYVGALPGVVVALALVTVTVHAGPLYQSVATLLLAYALLFLPRALTGLRA